MLAQLSEFWLNRDHSDVVLNIVIACADSACIRQQQHAPTEHARCGMDCPGQGPACCNCMQATVNHSMHQVLARVPCHRVLLSAASSYFAALLSPTWADGGTNTMEIRQIPIVLSDLDDVPAMIALLKCIYYGDVGVSATDMAHIIVPQHNLSATTPGASTVPSQEGTAEYCVCCWSCTQPLDIFSWETYLDKVCWQELSVRVIRLADQFSVPGVMKAAAGKLSCLFSYQLSWPAVLAVLWLPYAVAQQPPVQELRQMAINRVTQDMRHLDPCLSSSFGRSVLQQLPADALATLLSSDQLALLSENSTLVAIDVWLAGPVAAALSVTPRSAAATQLSADRGDDPTDKEQCQNNSNAASPGAPPARTEAANTEGSAFTAAAEAPIAGKRLTEALQLLLRQVRIPLCSGAFLAAAVCQRPWLCTGLRGSHELQLMEQYYSCDCQSRYDLAMTLLRSGQCCPWSVSLRRGLPAAFNVSNSSIHSSESTNGSSSSSSSSRTPPAYTLLSQVKAILTSGVHNNIDAVGLLSSSSSSLSSSSSMEANGFSLTASSRSNSMEDSSKCKQQLQQQQGPGRCWLQQVCSPGGSTALGVVIDSRVLAGYVWEMALVAMPASDDGGSCTGSSRTSSSSSGTDVTAADCCDHSAAASDCSATSHDSGREAVGQSKQQLCLSVCCKPAWAHVLDPQESQCDAAAVSHKAIHQAAAAARASHNAACGAALQHNPLNAAAGATDGPGSRTAAQGCITCGAVWAIAGAKAAEAVARHDPINSTHTAAGTGTNACTDACQVPAAGADTTGDVQMCDTSVTCKVAGTGNNSSSGAGVVPASSRAAHFDVVVGLQLLACSSEEQLQQLTGTGPGSIGSSQQGSLADVHAACLLEFDEPAGTAQALLPVNVWAINTGCNMLQSRPESAAAACCSGVGGGKVLQGWQPELWSMLAPNGILHWHVSIRPLND